LQTKTPPDLQGRVFAITGQLFMLATPFSFLLTGFLVDHLLEPAVRSNEWAWVAPVVGQEAGAGMGLLMVAVGLIILGLTCLIAVLPSIRGLEAQLPSYNAPEEQILP
jgi:MFS transporter, DHA3 family, macrolide efflux protein